MSHSNPPVRAVLFDADGVIQRARPGMLDEIRGLYGDADGVEAFIQDVFEAEQPCLVGEGDFAASLASVLARWNCDSTASDALSILTMIDPDTAVFDLIRSLRSNGTVAALATNQQHYRASHMLNTLGYLDEFDHILCSCYLGRAKPSRAYFQKSIDILGLPAEEMLFIDDHEKNVESARAEGLQSHRYHLDEGLDALVSILEHHSLVVR